MFDLEKSVQASRQQVGSGVTLDHSEKAIEPKESLGGPGLMILVGFYLKLCEV